MTPAAATSTVRAQMAAAARRIRRMKAIDRAAVGVITLGGVGIIVSVLGILVFIAAEAIPLFRSARVDREGSAQLQGAAAAGEVGANAFGVDEYRRYVYTVEADGQVVFFDFASGARAHAFPVPGLDGATVTSSSRSLIGQFLSAGLSDGRVALMQVRFLPQYTNQQLSGLTPEVRERRVLALDPKRRPAREVSYVEHNGRAFVCALFDPDDLVLWWTNDDETTGQQAVQVAPGERVRHVRAGLNGTFLAATDRGHVYHWALEPDLRLTDVSPVAEGEPVTALEFGLGGNSFLAGTQSGGVSGWFRAPILAGRAYAMVKAHEFERQGAPVVTIALSPRERSFATGGADGSIVLRHQTSERTLARLAPEGRLTTLLVTPKSDGILALHGTTLDRFALTNPHPETTWRTLFGKVWYEGYAEPEYVWQSTAATDDFEPKLSLVPLVFGTIKGTFYALLFAIPIAIAAALYTSQFMHAGLRAKVKPAVEIMAALPSVVIGFLAGLYLATLVERHLVSLALMIVTFPVFGTGGVFLWRLIPERRRRAFRSGTEIYAILVLLLVAGWLALEAGPRVEGWIFAGDARGWLQSALGVTYDQRNSLVVGLAMGFAVIPIIFTISEDAFTSVPQSLTAASLALGASRWQTAVRVVLPTASPGVFSAVMIGFGRAVGETMIVLMATGNTPVMDWSIFNGFRTLSANIAVEIPEAPFGGTLYRVLFLAAALLFTMTFLVNTLAEIVRQRLRDRFKAI